MKIQSVDRGCRTSLFIKTISICHNRGKEGLNFDKYYYYKSQVCLFSLRTNAKYCNPLMPKKKFSSILSERSDKISGLPMPLPPHIEKSDILPFYNISLQIPAE